MNQTVDKITQYLTHGGMFNPEAMEHHKVADLLLECRNELERLIVKCDKQAVVIRTIYAEQLPNQWFVAGELGEKDSNGLPQYIEVCPAYGVGWTQLYEKTDRTISTEGS